MLPLLLLLQAEYSKGYLTQAVEIVRAAGAVYIGAAGNWQGSAFEVEAAAWKVDSSNGNRRLLTFGTETSLELKIISRTIFALHVSGEREGRLRVSAKANSLSELNPGVCTCGAVRHMVCLFAEWRMPGALYLCYLYLTGGC